MYVLEAYLVVAYVSCSVGGFWTQRDVDGKRMTLVLTIRMLI